MFASTNRVAGAALANDQRKSVRGYRCKQVTERGRRQLSAIAAAALVLLCASTHAQGFEGYLSERLAYHQVAGAAIVLIEDGAIAQEIYLGHAHATNATPIDANAVFQVGSVSKPVAAWVVMTLVEAGLLDLDKPVSTYLTRWQLPPSEFDASEVTLRRLLSHTAGLSLHGYPGFVEGSELPSLEASLAGATNGSGAVFLQQAPGQGFSYSGGGYTLMQLLVEEVTGERFSAYAQRAVLAPLGMSSSSYVPDAQLRAKLVTPHARQRDPIPNHKFRAEAAASLHASARDIARFAIANVGPGAVLSTRGIELLHRPIAPAGRDQSIGLGFFVSADGRLVGHGGSNIGWKARLQFAPYARSGIVVLTNSESGGAFGYEALCAWDKELGPGALQRDCTAFAEGQAESVATLRNVTIALYIVVLVLIGLVVRRVMQQGAGLSWPPTALRATFLAVLVVLLVGWWAFFYTTLGAYLVSGRAMVLATIDFLPMGFREVSISVQCLIVVVIVLTVLGGASTRARSDPA